MTHIASSAAEPANAFSGERLPDAGPGAPERFPVQTLGFRRFALALLVVAFMLNFVDRQVVNILAEPIKRELLLADWQLGLMTGLAFALLYTIAGLPIARWADRGDRPRIIALAILVWSLFTALCGVARTFPQLLLGRIGVGIGEAGLTPAATSLIVDYTPREKRASALAIYYLGLPLGTLFGMALGGLVANSYGWRTAFLVVGIPGVLMAPVLLLALREPRRDIAPAAAAVPPLGAMQSLRLLWSIPTYRMVALGAAFQGVVGYGFAPFLGSFFARNHGAEVASLAAMVGVGPAGFLGLALGISTGLAGAVGVWLGGFLADRAGKQQLRAYVTIPAVAAAGALPAYAIVFSLDSAVISLVLLAIPNILGAMWMGPVHSTQQSVVPPELRSSATALLLFVLNLIGIGFGPLLVGFLSDTIASRGGVDTGAGLRAALITVSAFGPLSAWFFWSARASIAADYVS